MFIRIVRKLKGYVSVNRVTHCKYCDICRYCKGLGYIKLEEHFCKCHMCGGDGKDYRIY